jgi:alpha-tubulin suppressor-like RCC1 family protein
MSIAAGCFYTVVLNHDGKLYSSGCNLNGVLAQGARRDERRFLSIPAAGSFRKLDGGMQHWLAVDDDGRLWACGSNHYGQLGLLEIETLRLRAVKGFGGKRVASIACGLAHSLVCTAAGLLFAAGCNSDGQLGVGDFTNRSQFAAVYHRPGLVRSAGLPFPESSLRVSLAPGSLAAGGWHSACVDSEGCVRTWGSAIGTEPGVGLPAWCRAQMPIPSKLDPQLFGGDRVLAVAAGHFHAVAVTRRAVFSWGDAFEGCLGHGDWENLPLPKAIAPLVQENPIPYYVHCPDNDPRFLREGHVTSVACGPYHNIAVHSSGSVYVWGDNRKGQLGLGDRESPVTVPVSMFNFLAMQRSLDDTIMEARAGTEHCAAVSKRGELWTWGRCQAGGALKIPCGLGVVDRQTFAALPRRVTALFDDSDTPGNACLGRWHGICTRNALAWLMGTLPRGEQHPGTRRSRRIAELRICWVASLPEELVKKILDKCRGADGWFVGAWTAEEQDKAWERAAECMRAGAL